MSGDFRTTDGRLFSPAEYFAVFAENPFHGCTPGCTSADPCVPQTMSVCTVLIATLHPHFKPENIGIFQLPFFQDGFDYSGSLQIHLYKFPLSSFYKDAEIWTGLSHTFLEVINFFLIPKSYPQTSSDFHLFI